MEIAKTVSATILALFYQSDNCSILFSVHNLTSLFFLLYF